MGKLDKLNQQVRSCRLCRLCRLRLNGVPGEGNESAAVLFIGEGPGFNEDRDGRPFVGAAGQFLDELLELAGLQRPDVYITNVVKCRPPQNRDPLPDEIDACAPYLERQIATIDPVLIVTLGRFSMARFFPNDKISSVHGQARLVEGRVVMTMWHPAYGLRDPQGKESIKDDFRKIPAVMTQAHEVRAKRVAPGPAILPDVSALVAQHVAARTVEPAPLPAPTPEPGTGEPEDGFAYLAAVNGQVRKVAGRRKARVAAPALIDEPPGPPYTSGDLDGAVSSARLPHPEADPTEPGAVLFPAPAGDHESPSVAAEPALLIRPAGPAGSQAEAPTTEPGSETTEAKAKRPRRSKAAPGPVVAAAAVEPPPEPAEPGKKKGQQERDFQQLSLFE